MTEGGRQRKLFNEIETVRKLDILVNNAGTNRKKTLENSEEDL